LGLCRERTSAKTALPNTSKAACWLGSKSRRLWAISDVASGYIESIVVSPIDPVNEDDVSFASGQAESHQSHWSERQGVDISPHGKTHTNVALKGFPY